MDENNDFECALSGVITEGETFWDGDGLDDLPAGWFEVTIRRRIPNPQFLMVQQAKAAQVEIAMTQLPPNAPKHLRAAHRQMLSIQMDALYHSYEENIAPFFTVSETVHVSPVEAQEDLLEAFNDIREMLGLEHLPPIDTGEEDLPQLADDEDEDDEDIDDDDESEDDDEDE
jgi:hypothetical protein